MTFDAGQITGIVARVWWPVLRIGGFVLTAPIIGSSLVPRSARVGFSVALALLLAPTIAVPASLGIFSGAGILAAINQIVIGISIGLVVQLLFDALSLAGQTISMTMGLGYATLLDPQRGANTAVLGQMFTIFGTLIYLCLNGHLALLGSFVRSFQTMPVGTEVIGRNFFGAIAGWGAHVFQSGLLIALPATAALIIVNLALGVVTRAAPQLNLFGIGFPITILAGFFVLIVGLDSVINGIESLIVSSLDGAAELASGTVSGMH